MATLNLRINPQQMLAGASQGQAAVAAIGQEAIQTESAIERMVRSAGSGLQRFQRSASAAATAGIGALRTGVTRLSGVMAGARSQIQNVAFQVGDFATQVGAGTSAAVALGQQLPQLLGGFGALGAVLGAVVAIGVPLAASLLNVSSGSDTVSDSLDRLDDVISRLQGPMDILKLNLDELEEKYGSNAAKVRELAQSQALLEVTIANEALREQAAILEDVAGQYFSVGEEGRSGLGRLRGALADIKRDLSLSGQAAKDFEAAIQQAATGATLQEQQAALRTVVGILDEAGVAASDIPPELAKALADMISVSNAADEARALIEDIENAANGAAGGLSLSADQAGRLGDNLDRARRFMAQLAQTNANTITGFEENDPRGGGGPIFDGPTQFGLTRTSSRGSGRRRSGGGGRSSAATAAREAQQVQRAYDSLISSLDPLTRASMQFEEAQTTINDALARGHITADEAARAYALAQDRFIEMSDAARNAQDEFNTFDSVIDLSKDTILDFATTGQGAMDDLARSIQRAATEAALFGSGPLGEAFGGGSGLFGFLGDAFGGLFPNAKGNAFSGGRIVPFARGGVFDSPTLFPMRGGQTGLMGEAGPEAIMPLTRTSDGGLGVRASGGGNPVQIVINNNGSNTQVTAQQTSDDRIDINIEEGVSQLIEGGRMDRSMRIRYGLRPQPQAV